MKEGQQRNEGVVRFGADIDNVQHLAAVSAQVGVGEHDALGQAGSAPGVLQHDGVALGVGNGRRIASRPFAEALPGKNVLLS